MSLRILYHPLCHDGDWESYRALVLNVVSLTLAPFTGADATTGPPVGGRGGATAEGRETDVEPFYSHFLPRVAFTRRDFLFDPGVLSLGCLRLDLSRLGLDT